MIFDFIEILFTAGFWAATIRIACPLIFATLGEVICERSGVLNLGIEGIMSLGAMVGWMSVYLGADLYSGVLLAAIIGALFGFLHAIFTVYLGASQHVTGIGITMLASSIGFFSFRLILPSSTTPPKIIPFEKINIPYLSDIPFLGEALFQHTPFTYIAFISVIIIFWLLNSTPFGLSIKMAGENPMALEAQGILFFYIHLVREAGSRNPGWFPATYFMVSQRQNRGATKIPHFYFPTLGHSPVSENELFAFCVPCLRTRLMRRPRALPAQPSAKFPRRMLHSYAS